MGVHKLLRLAKTGICDQVPSVHQFHLQDNIWAQQEGGRKKRCHKQLQQQTMTSVKTDNPTYPNHKWVPPSLTTARRKFASTRRLLHKKTQIRILIAAPIRREYMKDAPADQISSVNAFDGSRKEEDGTNRTGEQKVQVLKSNGGPSEGYKPTKGGSQQRQHSYQKNVLDIASLCCSDSHG